MSKKRMKAFYRRAVFDHICGEAILIAVAAVIFWCVGYFITRCVDGGMAVLTAVIDWCGAHPVITFGTIALMIGVCVWVDCRCGDEKED